MRRLYLTTKAIFQCRRGNFGLFAAALLPMLFAGAGLAVDYANMSRAKVELQNMVDAAVLAASKKTATTPERKQIYQDLLQAQVQTVSDMTLVDQSIDQTVGVNFIRSDAYASVEIPLVFIGNFMPNRVSAAASTYFSTRAIEIAIALDNTGSMGSGGIAALKEASHALLNALGEVDTSQQSLKVGLIPFVTAVNVKGEGYNSAWIDTSGKSLYNGWTFLTEAQRATRKSSGHNNADFSAGNYPHHSNLFAWSGTTWKGCVEARPAPYNTSLDSPDAGKPNTLFVPYFAADEPGNRVTSGGNSSTGFNNSWLHDGMSGDGATVQRSITKYKTQTAVPRDFKDDTGPLTMGPNRACPTPIVPLTATLSKVRTGIDAMQYWNGSGTNIAEGLAWGWRVLSPQEPYAQAAPFGPDAASKILVIMTDGTNVSYGASNTINKSDYGSYGFLADKRINSATTQSAAEAYLNTSTANMCVEIKKLGIEVYTVLYKTSSSSVVNLFSNCASRKENFFMASDVVSLKKAFSAIGQSVSSVRLVN
ncbi:pilus assembly protein [Hoeflea sp. YIM 152468]|uniref:pilus assembly protein n=1 Tax=Hoeflea sp. YIM 152468 TaxID=3031759 RepID=UPI0023DC59AB|nr:pilus assembly protein [Hoeflea sp. YIM 152468]MDF1609626.1 pilus assembly protein [Hoeflea sp. YIM 152468]